MKIRSIHISNFLGARAVDLRLDKPVTLVAGKNGAGKSSIRDALALAFTADMGRVALKKDAANLISEGGESCFVEVVTGADTYGIAITPSGKISDSREGKETPAAMPYVLDAQRFARMTDNERRTFLLGLIGVKMDGPSIKERLLAKGCDAAKVEQVMPILRAGFDAAQKEAAAKARDAKASWKTTTGGETWGKDKAAKWQPAPLPDDAEKAGRLHENAVAKTKEADQELGTAQQELGAAKSRVEAHRQALAQREELADKAGRIERIQKKLEIDEAELKEWQAKVDDARSKAGITPVNPMSPGDFLLRGLARVTSEFLELSCNHPDFEWDTSLLNRAATHIAEFRKLHGEPVCGDSPAKPDPEAQENLPKYEKALALLQSAVANDKRDLSEAEQAATRLQELDHQAAAEPIDIELLQARVAELAEKRNGWRADADKYRAVAEQAASRKAVIEKAAALHADVLAWTDIADALAPDGIQGEILAEALEPINEHLRLSAADAEWEPAQINADMSITYGLRDYAMISESEKWRTDAMIAEAVSFLSGMRLLVLDRFDVLDQKAARICCTGLTAWPRTGTSTPP